MTYTPYITSELVCDMLLEAVAKGEDPLGISTSMQNGQPGIDQSTAEKVVFQALSSLTNEQAVNVEAALRRAKPREEARLDRATVRILAERGLDPLAVAWLATIDEGLQVIDNDTFETIVNFDGSSRGAQIALAENAWWNVTNILTIKDLPATVVAAAVGRPLRHVVSHHVLDLHPFHVAQARTAGDMTHLQCTREEWILDGFHKGPIRVDNTATTTDLVKAYERRS